MLTKTFYFLALFFAALALGPALAHLLELPNKIGLSREDYLIVQQIYRGWALLGIVVFGALISTLSFDSFASSRTVPIPLQPIGFLCIAGTQLVFWTYTYPANQATQNWTILGADWAALRRNWEYSHATSAGLNLLAMAALIVSVLNWRRNSRRMPNART